MKGNNTILDHQNEFQIIYILWYQSNRSFNEMKYIFVLADTQQLLEEALMGSRQLLPLLMAFKVMVMVSLQLHLLIWRLLWRKQTLLAVAIS